MPGPCAARAVIRELRGSPEILDPLCGKGFARKNTRIFGEPLSFPLPERSFMGLPLGFWSRWSEWQTMHSTGWSEARLLKRIGIGVRPYENFAHILGETRGAYQAFEGGWAFLQISFGREAQCGGYGRHEEPWHLGSHAEEPRRRCSDEGEEGGPRIETTANANRQGPVRQELP